MAVCLVGFEGAESVFPNSIRRRTNTGPRTAAMAMIANPCIDPSFPQIYIATPSIQAERIKSACLENRAMWLPDDDLASIDSKHISGGRVLFAWLLPFHLRHSGNSFHIA